MSATSISCSCSNWRMTDAMLAPDICHAYAACNARRRARLRAARSMPSLRFWAVMICSWSGRSPRAQRRHLERRERGFGALIAFVATGARERLRFVLAREHAVRDRDAAVARDLHQPARRFVHDHVVEAGLAAHHATQRDDGVGAATVRDGTRG